MGAGNLKIENILSMILILSVNWEEVTNIPWPSLWNISLWCPISYIRVGKNLQFPIFQLPFQVVTAVHGMSERQHLNTSRSRLFITM